MGIGNIDAPLIILLEEVEKERVKADGFRVLSWLMLRMSLTSENVYVTYDTEEEMELRRKAILDPRKKYFVHMGKSLVKKFKDIKEAFTGQVVHTHSLSYLLMSPAECNSVARVLWRAAEKVNLKPVLNPNYQLQFPHFYEK